MTKFSYSSNKILLCSTGLVWRESVVSASVNSGLKRTYIQIIVKINEEHFITKL